MKEVSGASHCVEPVEQPRHSACAWLLMYEVESFVLCHSPDSGGHFFRISCILVFQDHTVPH